MILNLKEVKLISDVLWNVTYSWILCDVTIRRKSRALPLISRPTRNIHVPLTKALFTKHCIRCCYSTDHCCRFNRLFITIRFLALLFTFVWLKALLLAYSFNLRGSRVRRWNKRVLVRNNRTIQVAMCIVHSSFMFPSLWSSLISSFSLTASLSQLILLSRGQSDAVPLTLQVKEIITLNPLKHNTYILLNIKQTHSFSYRMYSCF